MEGSFLIIALGLGLTTSLHCVGMCGPIAFSLGISPKNKFGFTTKNLTYQLGRVTTYTSLGALLGLLGFGASFAGMQQPLSIFAGLLMILMAVLPKNLGNQKLGYSAFSKLMIKLKTNLGKFMQRKNYSSLYITGILNGFLPCGAVYAALTGSLAMGSVLGGAAFMFVFGLGTIPLMFVAVMMGQVLTVQTRQKILKFLPILMVLLGLLFILRGLGLGIPFISPMTESLQIDPEVNCD